MKITRPSTAKNRPVTAIITHKENSVIQELVLYF